MSCSYTRRAYSRGVATVEMVIALPILLLLLFGVFELARAYQVQNMATALTREGANLASRSFSGSEQEIMDVLAISADPLDFAQDGSIYISVVVGEQDNDPFVLAQHRWLNSGFVRPSKTWGSCGFWQLDGTCQLPNPPPRLATFPLALDPGETVYVVEVFYEHSVIGRYVFDGDMVVHSQTMM